MRYIFLSVLIFASITAISQQHQNGPILDAADLKIGANSMQAHLEKQFISSINSFTDAAGSKGTCWVKLQFDKSGYVQHVDISTGATPSINFFLLKELKQALLVNNNYLQSVAETITVVVPVRYWIYKRGTSLTRKIQMDDQLLLDFFSAKEGTTKVYHFIPEVVLMGPIS
ncbi:MAG: hypothetical protein ACO1OO_01810 [Flavisolibacter sp.]